jgi:hypothetical protein
MAETTLTLDMLIARVRAGYESASALDRLSHAVDVAARVAELGDNLVGFYVDEARRDGASWAEVGARLGVTRQAVQKRFLITADRDRPGFWDRATDGLKAAVTQARSEARSRRKTYLGTEHLLLGLVGDDRMAAVRALRACGTDPATIRAAVNGRIGVPAAEPLPDETPFTALSLRALQHSLRESLRAGRDTVGTEHLILGLLTVGEGQAHDALINLGLTYDLLRAAAEDEPTTPNAPDGDPTARRAATPRSAGEGAASATEGESTAQDSAADRSAPSGPADDTTG